MKKLLLFAVSMGISALSIAQTPAGLVSTDAVVSPTGTIYTEADGNGTTLLEVTVTNNETNGFVYPGAFTQFNFSVTIDGVEINDPTNGTVEWVVSIPNDLNPGSSANVVLSTSWAPQADPGEHEFCVKLKNALIAGTSNPFVTITDANKDLCENRTFAWPVGINDLETAEIANVINNGEEMTVFVKNAGNSTEIKLMSITGQVVKTLISSNGGQDFNETFDISSLTSGVYILSVQGENGASQAQKVFIQ